ncbi:hypothetical protein RIR_jg7834.t1 [Rhizophagus irregularis DAOM 181602=DAOM 197198]|nr:hypothetical protein RIR_jg7834.t1 [Rhizophagus irregularis DAOM 181602=DAOM 197198]
MHHRRVRFKRFNYESKDYDPYKKQVTPTAKHFHYIIDGTDYVLTLERKKDITKIFIKNTQQIKRIETVYNMINDWPKTEEILEEYEKEDIFTMTSMIMN